MITNDPKNISADPQMNTNEPQIISTDTLRILVAYQIRILVRIKYK
jgi:hypothetical protein